MIQLGVVGCGDVAVRTYLPGIVLLQHEASVAACFDPLRERAERAATFFPHAHAYTSYEELLSHDGLDAVINLTPAPFHHDVTAAALDAGLHVFSEKPLAGTVADAQDLIAQAQRQQRMLLCAPATMVTTRFRWIREILAAGRIGRPTLVTGQMATMGPAAWREYTGDPAVFYGADVGPLLDIGVYLLHAITGLLGPARRVQAMGGIVIPQRTVLSGPHQGKQIEVAANDQMLVQLDLGNTTFAQIVASYAISDSKAPVMEVHGTHGSISMSLDNWYDPNGTIDIFVRDDSPLGLSGWIEAAPPSVSRFGSTIAFGPAHFVACLQGKEQPVLTAEHARHVLEIIVKAGQSAHEGRALELETSF